MRARNVFSLDFAMLALFGVAIWFAFTCALDRPVSLQLCDETHRGSVEFLFLCKQ